jgi:hypothetical protein
LDSNFQEFYKKRSDKSDNNFNVNQKHKKKSSKKNKILLDPKEFFGQPNKLVVGSKSNQQTVWSERFIKNNKNDDVKNDDVKNDDFIQQLADNYPQLIKNDDIQFQQHGENSKVLDYNKII